MMRFRPTQLSSTLRTSPDQTRTDGVWISLILVSFYIWLTAVLHSPHQTQPEKPAETKQMKIFTRKYFSVYLSIIQLKRGNPKLTQHMVTSSQELRQLVRSPGRQVESYSGPMTTGWWCFACLLCNNSVHYFWSDSPARVLTVIMKIVWCSIKHCLTVEGDE